MKREAFEKKDTGILLTRDANDNIDKTIMMTYDYELFLKNSGTFENCLLRPVDKLIEYSARRGITGTYFVDALYCIRLNESKETAKDAGLLKINYKG